MRKGKTKVAASVAGPARDSSFRYWLIVKNDNGTLEALTINLGGQEALPIFSFREEAEMFIWFEACDGWCVREVTALELASLLSGPYSRVKMVALDPLPETCDEGMTRLVSLSRKVLARKLLGDRG